MKDLDELKGRFERISRTLPPELLTGGLSLEAELLADLTSGDNERFLGFYSQTGMQAVFEAYGVYDTLRARGYRTFDVRFDLSPYHDTVRLFADDVMILECRLRRTRGVDDPCIAEYQRRFVPELLAIDWLTLGDPRGRFSPTRPRLPGQRLPGSGIGPKIFVLLYICARRLKRHGLIEIPQFFHNAVIYRRETRFIDPAFEGRFLALMRLLDDHPLPALAWAMAEGRIIDEARGEVRWEPRAQMLVIDPRLEAYYELPAWRRMRDTTRDATRLRVLPPPPGWSAPTEPDGAPI